MTRQPTCKDCKFWWAYQAEGASDGSGNCRRYAPRPIFGMELMAATAAAGADAPDLFRQPLWPRTQAADGCGEFHVRDVPVF